MKCENTLQKLDILGQEFQLKVKDGTTYRTGVGGLLTILLFILPWIAIYLFGRDIVEKQNPSFLFRKLRMPSYPFLYMNSTNYFFSLRVGDDSGGVIDDVRFFEILFGYQLYELNNNTGNLDAKEDYLTELTHCNSSHIDETTLANEDLSSYYCANIKNLELGGSWGESKVGVFVYQIKLCDNQTEAKYNTTCYTPEERVKLKGDKYYVEVKNLNRILDPSNFTNPVKNVIEYQFQVIELTFSKRNYFFYSESSLATDIGLFQEEIIFENYTQIEKTSLDIFTLKKDNVVFQSEIQLTNLKVEYGRIYIKLQGIAATVGGFCSITYYIIKLLIYFYVDNHMQHFFYENLFDLKIEKDVMNSKAEEQFKSMSIIPFETKADLVKETKKESSQKDTTSKRNKEEYDVDDDGSNSNNNEIDFKTNTENNAIVLPDSAKKNDSFSKKIKEEAYKLVKKKSTGNLKKKIEDVEADAIQHKRSVRKRLTTMVEFKKKERFTYSVTKLKLCDYRYCFCFHERDSHYINLVKNQLLYVTEYNLNKNLDALSWLKTLDQFKVIKQILLNENQCYMLDNKGKKVITNSKVYTKDNFDKIVEEKMRIEENNLVSYLKTKQNSRMISEIDKFLFELMDDDIKERVRLSLL